jgi:hypothetical protein
MRASLIALLLTVASQAGAECGKLCDRSWWQTAVAGDVQAEFSDALDLLARDDTRNTVLHFAY